METVSVAGMSVAQCFTLNTQSYLPVVVVVVVFESWPLSAKDKDIAVVTATQPTAKMTRQMRVMDIENLLLPAVPLSEGSRGILSDSSGFPISRQGSFYFFLIKLPISRKISEGKLKVFFHSLILLSVLILSHTSFYPYILRCYGVTVVYVRK